MSPPSTSRPGHAGDSGGSFGRIGPQVGRLEIEAAGVPLGIVVGDVDPNDPLQMSAAEHERRVEALAPDGPDPSFGEGVCPGSRTGVRMTWVPSLANTGRCWRRTLSPGP